MAQERILLIDDDPSFLEITGAILRRFGYEVLSANNTAEGLQYIRVRPWMTIFPGIFIMLSVLSLNMVGDGLRDVLDPKLKK